MKVSNQEVQEAISEALQTVKYQLRKNKNPVMLAYDLCDALPLGEMWRKMGIAQKRMAVNFLRDALELCRAAIDIPK